MNATEKLEHAIQYAMAHRPKIGGFPFLAECLRKAGVEKNVWSLPGVQSIYIMEHGSLVQQGTPLVTGLVEIPVFDQRALITALRIDQEGKSTFPEFLNATWSAGVVSYEVDLVKRNVRYVGVNGEQYVEEYAPVEVPELVFPYSK